MGWAGVRHDKHRNQNGRGSGKTLCGTGARGARMFGQKFQNHVYSGGVGFWRHIPLFAMRQGP